MKLKEITQTVKGNVQNIDDLLGSLEAAALAVTTRAAAWVSTIPTVILTSRTISNVFQLSDTAGLLSSVALEIVGQSTADLWISAKDFNQTKRKTDIEANERLAFAMMTVYFVSDFALVSVLELPKVFNGEVGHLASLLFPIMQIVSTLVLTERAKQFKRVAAIETEKQEKRATRAQPIAQPVAQPVAQVDKKQAVISFFTDNPKGTQEQAAEVAQCSRQYVSKLLTTLETQGAIKRNGKGVEILTMG